MKLLLTILLFCSTLFIGCDSKSDFKVTYRNKDGKKVTETFTNSTFQEDGHCVIINSKIIICNYEIQPPSNGDGGK